MTSIHFLNRLSCYSLEAQEPILIYLTVYFVPISSAYGKLELGLDGFVGMRGMTLVGGDIPNRGVEKAEERLSKTRGGTKFCEFLLEGLFQKESELVGW